MVRHGTKASICLQTVRYRNIAGACSKGPQASEQARREARKPRRPGESSTMGESMIAGFSVRRTVRTWRRGRHTIPGQVEKVARQARTAALAVAIVGTLVAALQASPALAASIKPVTATAQSHTTAAGLAASTGAHTATTTFDPFEPRSVI